MFNYNGTGTPTISGNNSYVVGNDNTVATDNSFVIGNNVKTTAANSVNLGSESAAITARTDQTAGTTEYASTTINGKTYNFAGATPTGVVSVGDVGSVRRVQNVAAGLIGEKSTDAINGSQLYATNKAVEALQTGGAGIVQYSNADSPTTPNGGTASNDVTLVGADQNVPVVIHNVGAGVYGTERDASLAAHVRITLYRLIQLALAASVAPHAGTSVQIDVRFESAQAIARVDATRVDTRTLARVGNMVEDSYTREMLELIDGGMSQEPLSGGIRVAIIVPIGDANGD